MSDQQALGRESAPPAPRRRLAESIPHIVAVLLAMALVIGIATNWNSWVGSPGAQWTDDAYLQSDLTPLSALVSGPVTRVAVDDYQAVKAGDLLVEIDRRTYEAQLTQAEANVAAAQAAIENSEAQQQLQLANIASAEAQLSSVQAAKQRDDAEAVRQQSLLQTGIAGTRQNVERADAARKISDAQVVQAGANAEAARRQLKVQQTQEQQLQASLRAAEALRDLAQINLGYTRVTAPTDGVVGQRRVYPGQFVGIGTQVIAVIPLPNLYIVANYKETQLTHLQVGQHAEFKVDTFPGVTLHGHVTSWSPGTGSQFALLPSDNATGNFTKVVQRIPVKLAIDDDGRLGLRLRPGMSVEVTIHTDENIAAANEK
jgi:membrane fusion protein (multidrug efflux system)